MLKRLLEIKKRKAELAEQVETLTGEDLDNAVKEVDELVKEEAELQKRQAITKEVEKRGSAIVTPVEKDGNEEPTADNVIDSAEYRSAYLKQLQGKALTDAEKRALTTATSSVGAVIPTVTMNKIIEKLGEYGVILPLVTTLNIPSNVKMPVEGDSDEANWVAEGATASDGSAKVGEVSLSAHELIRTIEITAHVGAMSIDAFEGFIVAQLAKKAKKAIDNAIINGDGSGKATGILKGATALETAETTYGYDDIMEILANLSSGYKQGAKFVMSTKTLYRDVAKIKDNDKAPIFKAETDGKFEGKLSGYPVVTYDNVPEGTIIFGDFSYYFFNFVKAFEIAKDTSVGFKSGKTCYRALALADGNVGLQEAFVVMGKKSA